MAETSIQKPIDREAVRLLAIEIGVRESARKLGLNEDTVCSWAKRGNWFATPAVTYNKPVQAMQAPGDVMLDTIAEHGARTKLGLSAYATRQAEHLASEGKLSDHNAFRNIAAGSSTLHGWNEAKQSASFTLNVLNLGSLDVSVDPTLD